MISHRSGSVLGGILLVAGSCIGAGMLALPILTGLLGFIPSLILLFIAWGFMTFTGLLLVEVNGWFNKQINLLSMAREALGPKGSWTAWISYVFLFYSILVAYTAASGSIFSAIFSSLFSIEISSAFVSTVFTVLFGIIIYLGTRIVDLCNRTLMIGLLTTYFSMIGIGFSHINPMLLLHRDYSYALLPLPVLVISFGFQNMIPSLTAYVKGDLKKVRIIILGGSLLAFTVYLIWLFLVLGVLDIETISKTYETGEETTLALTQVLGSNRLAYFAQGFAFFAIVTSFLAQGLTLSHFLADGFQIIPSRKNLWWLCALALLPPLLLALHDPQIFFKALGFAGGICAMILFGILPVCMAWVGRYKRKHKSKYHVAGGKFALIVAFFFSIFMIGYEISRIF
jgi:tyrosine-specific transport protein